MRNLADPDYEPTDEDLRELSREAFSGVREKFEKTLAAFFAGIEAARAEQRAKDAASK